MTTPPMTAQRRLRGYTGRYLMTEALEKLTPAQRKRHEHKLRKAARKRRGEPRRTSVSTDPAA